MEITLFGDMGDEINKIVTEGIKLVQEGWMSLL